MTTSVADLIAADVLTMSDGYRTKRSEHAKEGYRILRVADVLNDDVRLDGPDFVSSEFTKAIGVKAAQAGDVLLTTKGTVGRVAVMPSTDQAVVYSPQLCFFRVRDTSQLDPRWLSYWFRSGDFMRQASHRKDNTDMAAYINLADIRSLTFELPSIHEQRGIAEVLGALDDKIAANTRLRSASENLLRANFEALGIDTSPVEGTQLHEVVTLNPTTPKPAEEVAVYLEMKHLPDSSMTVTSWSYREPRGGARFVNGDTLLARITPCLENGKTGHVDFLAQGQVGIGSTEYIVMRAKTDTPTVLPYFLATSPAFRDVAIRRMVGTSGRQRLSAADIADYLVSWPSADKLVTFDRLASSLMPRVKAATDETRHLIETRDALLPLLMSGKVSVKDAESVVGEVL